MGDELSKNNGAKDNKKNLRDKIAIKDAPIDAFSYDSALLGVAGDDSPVQKKNQDEESQQKMVSKQPFPNIQSAISTTHETGLPRPLKSGVENLSGHSMDDVRVHYNSSNPAQMKAHAYAQGTEIHVAPGQEQHLPHEAWHVAQQKQGRVNATTQFKGVNINDDKGLEAEADTLGALAVNAPVQKQPLHASTVQSNAPIQRVPVGTGQGTDNDRNNIAVEDLAGNETLRLRGDNHGRASIRLLSNFTVNNQATTNRLLKHYMVVKNGAKYQFPIKHVYTPRENQSWRRNMPTTYTPNAGNRDTHRGGQPEAFGGNHDLNQNQTLNQSLTTSRDATLNKEYAEENSDQNRGGLQVQSSKKFTSNWAAGTLSIASTDQDIQEGYQTNANQDSQNRGETEMAGTVVIDCDDLVGGVLVGDALEVAIGNKIQHQRDQFFQNNPGLNRNGNRQQGNIFASRAGILAHLVSMVKDDIINERAQRNIQPLQQIEDDQDQEVEEELQEVNDADERDQVLERGMSNKTKVLIGALIALGLAFLISQIFG